MRPVSGTWLRRRTNDAFVIAVVAAQAGALAPWFASGRGVGDGLVLQGAFGAAYLVAALLLFGRLVRRRRVRVSPWMWWPLVFLGLATASLLWSDVPELTARRVVALAGTLVFAAWIAETMDPRRALRNVALGLLVIAGASFVLLAVAPQIAVHAAGSHAGNWRGALLHKNLLGREMALATTLALGMAVVAPRRWRLAWLAAAAATALLVLGARSATGLVLIAVGTLTVTLMAVPAVGQRERMGRRVLVVATIATATALVGALAVVLLDALGRDLTFTGRDRIWQVTLDVLRDRALTGAGFGAFWDGPGGAEVSAALGYSVGHAHNGLLQAATSLGIPGVLLVLTLQVGAFVRALRAPAFRAARPLALGFLLHFAVLGVSDAVMSGPNSLSLTIALALVLMRPGRPGGSIARTTPAGGGAERPSIARTTGANA